MKPDLDKLDPNTLALVNEVGTALVSRIEALEKSNAALQAKVDTMTCTFGVVVNASGHAKPVRRLSRPGVVGATVES